MSGAAPPPVVLAGLAALAARPGALAWRDFRPGIALHQIYGTMGAPGPSACLLKYAPGARVAFHRHTGWEHIYVLSGVQSDENGTYGAGDLLVSPPGSGHSVVSAAGCIVLAIYESPVSFEAPPT